MVSKSTKMVALILNAAHLQRYPGKCKHSSSSACIFIFSYTDMTVQSLHEFYVNL